MLPAALQLQVRHMAWADAALWRAVLAHEEARADARMRGLLYHVHVVQRYYLQLLRQEPPGVPEESSFAGMDELHAWGRTFYDDVAAFVATLPPEALGRPVPIPWAAQLVERFGEVHEPSLEECLLQVVLHTGHHRAQLCTRLRELSGGSPLVDFIAWVWQGKPEPEWPRLPPPAQA